MGDIDNVVIGGSTVLLALQDIGYIKDGVVIKPTAEHYFVEDVEGFPGRHAAKRIRENYSISFTVIEPTLDNIRRFWDVTNTKAGTDPLTLAFGGDSVDPQIAALYVTGIAPGTSGLTRQVHFDRVMVEDPGEMKITDFAEAAIPVTMTCLYNSTASRIGYFSDDQP